MPTCLWMANSPLSKAVDPKQLYISLTEQNEDRFDLLSSNSCIASIAEFPIFLGEWLVAKA